MALAPLDFPASPTVGLLYPDPPVTGQPTYKWDGAQWLAYRASGTPGLTVPAAPFDALAYNGMQVNGSMEVSQERAIGTSISNIQGPYVLDGWLQASSLSTGAGTFVAGPVGAQLPGNYLQFQVTTAQATIGSNFVRLIQNIEGYRFSRVAWGTANAQPLTIGFWARAALAGTYGLYVFNFDNSANTALLPFTLAGGGTFQWVTVQVPAVTTGTWKSDNNIGAKLMFEVCSSATPNIMATNGNYFSITGVVVLPGIEAPTAAQSPLIMRPFDQELLTCRRYFQRYQGVIVGGYGPGASVIYNSIPLSLPMRAAPTITTSGAYSNASGLSTFGATNSSIIMQIVITATGYGFANLDAMDLNVRL
jgi:hypothetical protein